MTKVTIRLTNTDRDYTEFFDSVLMLKDKIVGIKNNKKVILADTFYHQIVPFKNRIVLNSIQITDEFKKLLNIPEEIETIEAWTFTMETL